jgi:hypothetical protein
MGYSNIILEIPIISSNEVIQETAIIQSDNDGFFNFDNYNMDASMEILLIAQKSDSRKRIILFNIILN